MQSLGKYIFTLTAAAILCSILRQILGEKGSAAEILKMATSVFLVLTAITPLVKMQIPSVDGVIQDYASAAGQSVTSGRENAQSAIEEIIIRRTRAYIQDKALALGGNLSVEVMVEGAPLPAPRSVLLCGSISPYGKQVLQALIRDELGIPMEEQTWKC